MFDVTYQAGGGRRKSLIFNGQCSAIGSDKNNDLVLKERRVEKFHAELSYRDGQCMVRDLGSRSGTFINGNKVTEQVVVSDTDEIVIGNTRLWVHNSQAAAMNDSTVVGLSQEFYAGSLTNDNSEGIGDINSLENTASSDCSNNKCSEALIYWGNVVHERLLKQMDLRRKEVHRMSDQQLRKDTEALIAEILQSLRSSLPEDLDTGQLTTRVLSEAIGLGPLERFLNDDSVSEIMVNNFSEVFVEREGKIVRSDFGFSSDQAVLSVIERIITPIGRRIDESSPMVDARLKDGSRVNAVIAPLSLTGPSLTIRKFSKQRLLFSDLVRFGALSQEMADFLRICVETRKNIVVSGGTGSGKTTLLNVLSSFIPNGERIVTVEDAAELQLDQSNLVALEAKPANLEGRGEITIRDLLKNTLRMRPDRIVVGECRGGEALDMLQAMNTGHDGCLTTAHANSPRDIISRLEVMALMSGMTLPVTAVREQIASAVDIVVQQTRYPCGTRKISRITEVVGIESGTVQLQDIFAYQRQGYDQHGKVQGDFKPLGFIPTFYEDLSELGMSLDLAIFKNQEDAGYARF